MAAVFFLPRPRDLSRKSENRLQDIFQADGGRVYAPDAAYAIGDPKRFDKFFLFSAGLCRFYTVPLELPRSTDSCFS